MTTAIALPMQDLQTMAKALADSGMFGFKTPQQALAIMLVAQAQGIPAAQACVDFDLIQGKPAMTARAMLARFQQAGGIINWIEYSDEVCEAEFSHPQCPRPVKIRWTMDDARRAGLTGKDNWKKYPRQMLSSRVMSEGVDRCYPSASGGFYPPEVVQDFGGEKNITPTAGAADNLTQEQINRMDELAMKMHDWLSQGSVGDALAEMDNAAPDAEEKTFLWTKFDSKQRAAMKKHLAEAKREKQIAAIKPVVAAESTEPDTSDKPPADTISAAAHKRLEARIKELGADRDKLKAYVSEKYGINHLNELTKEAYKAVDAMLDKRAELLSRKAAEGTDAPAIPYSQTLRDAQTIAELDAALAAIPEDDRDIYLAAYEARKEELVAQTEGGL